MTNVHEECGPGLMVTTAEATVVAAAKLMREYDVGALAVLDGATAEARRCLGLVTDRDLVTEVTALGLDPATITVGDLARSGLTGHRAQDELRRVFGELHARGVRELRVARAGEVSGVVLVEELLLALTVEA